MKKINHTLLTGVSVLPVFLITPAMAVTEMSATAIPGLVDDYVEQVINQLPAVLNAQNENGFQIGKVTIGTNMDAVDGQALRYGIDSNVTPHQYVKMESFGLPTGMGSVHLDMPLYNSQTGKGLTPDDINKMEFVLAVNGIDSSDTTLQPSIADGKWLLDDMVESDFLAEDTWVLGNLESAMASGKITTQYLYTADTGGGFVIDGNYGNMAEGFISPLIADKNIGELVDNFADIVSWNNFQNYKATILNDAFDTNSSALSAVSDDDNEQAVQTYLGYLNQKLSTLNALNVKIGELSMDGGNVTLANNMTVVTSKIAIDGGNMTVTSPNANITVADVDLAFAGQWSDKYRSNQVVNNSSTEHYAKRDIAISGENTTLTVANGAKLTVSGAPVSVTDGALITNNGTLNALWNANGAKAIQNNGTMTIGEGSVFNGNAGAIYNSGTANIGGVNFASNIATTNGGAIYNAGTVSLTGTNTFTGNKANNVANDIHNVGTVTVASGTTTLDGGITGDGELTIAEGATLNIGSASVAQTAIHLQGTMLATLRDGNAQITATTFDGDNGTLRLSFAGEGTYHVFGGSAYREAGIDVTSSMYDISWINENKDMVVSLKSVEDIAKDNGIEKDTAAAVVGLNESTSSKLNDLGVLMQEKLAEATPEAKHEVEEAAKAIHPETESVTQSVATSVQTTVTNLASARMAAPTIGRNGGDLDLTSGGVWAQGLFNKSKQNDAFNGYTRGIAVGMDGTINKVWTIGAGYSYAHSDITGSERDTEIDSNTVFLYGQYKPAEWYVNAVLNYTMSDFSEEGTVMGTPVTGDYDVDSYGATVATGYDFASGITPELGLRYMHVDSEAYTNSLGIKTSSKDTDFLTGILGARYAFNVVADQYTTFIPQLNAGLKYDIVSDKNVSTVAMPGLTSYTLNGERLSRFGGEFGIGLGIKHRSMEFSINYDIDVRKDYTSQTGMLKFRYNF